MQQREREEEENLLRDTAGFTLIELMIVVVIIGILAAISIPNFARLQDRAKEGATKSNMHTFQVAAEDESIRNDGVFATTASAVATNIIVTFTNPFDMSSGSGNAWEDRATMAAGPTPKAGLVSYADSSAVLYNIKGYGKAAALPVVLTTGR